MRRRTFSLIGAPTSAGAYAPGQEKAPLAVRKAGLLDKLVREGLDVVDEGDVSNFRWKPDRSNPRAMHAHKVASIAGKISDGVRRVWADDRVALVVGGDCTVELGVVAAATKLPGKFGLVYVDGDADMRTPETTSDGALDWMGVAHMLCLPGCVQELTDLAPRRPMLAPEELTLFGTWNVRDDEKTAIADLGIAFTSVEDVAGNPAAAAGRAVEWGRQFEHLIIHLDVDVLDFEDFPLAENTRRKRGLTLSQLMTSLEVLTSAPNLAALAICEINPDHGASDGSTIERFTDEFARCLSGGSSFSDLV